MTDHAHDAAGNCVPAQGFVAAQAPAWQFSLWDIVGILITTVAGWLSMTSSGMNLVARECSAHAQWRRNRYEHLRARFEHQQARQQLTEDLEVQFRSMTAEEES